MTAFFSRLTNWQIYIVKLQKVQYFLISVALFEISKSQLSTLIHGVYVGRGIFLSRTAQRIESVRQFQDKCVKIRAFNTRDGTLEKWRGVGNFPLARIFFSARCLCRIFLGWNPLCTSFFFSDKYCLFLYSEILIHYLCFCALFILQHSEQIKGYRSLFNEKSFRKCTHSERGGSHLEWMASLCIFWVLPSGIPLPQPIIMMPYSVHQNEGGKGFMRDAWYGLKLERDAWKLFKKKRDSWITERMWRVIYFMRYAWFVNYLCLVVKISFPWGFSDNDCFKTWRVNFVKICAWNGITIPPLTPSKTAPLSCPLLQNVNPKEGTCLVKVKSENDCKRYLIFMQKLNDELRLHWKTNLKTHLSCDICI